MQQQEEKTKQENSADRTITMKSSSASSDDDLDEKIQGIEIVSNALQQNRREESAPYDSFDCYIHVNNEKFIEREKFEETLVSPLSQAAALQNSAANNETRYEKSKNLAQEAVVISSSSPYTFSSELVGERSDRKSTYLQTSCSTGLSHSTHDKMTDTAKTAKFIVSFNSDTSSEEESSDNECKSDTGSVIDVTDKKPMLNGVCDKEVVNGVDDDNKSRAKETSRVNAASSGGRHLENADSLKMKKDINNSEDILAINGDSKISSDDEDEEEEVSKKEKKKKKKKSRADDEDEVGEPVKEKKKKKSKEVDLSDEEEGGKKKKKKKKNEEVDSDEEVTSKRKEKKKKKNEENDVGSDDEEKTSKKKKKKRLEEGESIDEEGTSRKKDKKKKKNEETESGDEDASSKKKDKKKKKKEELDDLNDAEEGDEVSKRKKKDKKKKNEDEAESSIKEDSVKEVFNAIKEESMIETQSYTKEESFKEINIFVEESSSSRSEHSLEETKLKHGEKSELDSEIKLRESADIEENVSGNQVSKVEEIGVEAEKVSPVCDDVIEATGKLTADDKPDNVEMIDKKEEKVDESEINDNDGVLKTDKVDGMDDKVASDEEDSSSEEESSEEKMSTDENNEEEESSGDKESNEVNKTFALPEETHTTITEKTPDNAVTVSEDKTFLLKNESQENELSESHTVSNSSETVSDKIEQVAYSKDDTEISQEVNVKTKNLVPDNEDDPLEPITIDISKLTHSDDEEHEEKVMKQKSSPNIGSLIDISFSPTGQPLTKPVDSVVSQFDNDIHARKYSNELFESLTLSTSEMSSTSISQKAATGIEQYENLVINRGAQGAERSEQTYSRPVLNLGGSHVSREYNTLLKMDKNMEENKENIANNEEIKVKTDFESDKKSKVLDIDERFAAAAAAVREMEGRESTSSYNEESSSRKMRMSKKERTSFEEREFSPLSPVRTSRGIDEDGNDTIETERTYVSKSRSTTDDLIKRILAEARGESPGDDKRGSKARVNMGGDQGYMSPRTAAADDDDDGLYRKALDRASSQDSESFMQRRMHSMDKKMDVSEESSQQGLYHHKYDESEDGSMESDSLRGGRYSRDGWKKKQKAVMDDEFDTSSYRSGDSGRQVYDPRGGMMLGNNYNDFDDEDDDDVFYNERRRQLEEEFIPDEEFVPQKSEETDYLVKEKSAEIRGVIGHQESVLQKLRKASDSFDELTSEIRMIKQQSLESTMRRSMLLDEIQYDIEATKEQAIEEPNSYRAGRGSRRYKSDFKDYAEEYNQIISSAYNKNSKAANISLDRDLEDDKIGSGALSNLARYGASSSSTVRRKKYTDDIGEDEGYGGYKASKYDVAEDSYTSYKKKYTRSRSLVNFDAYDDMDTKSNRSIEDAEEPEPPRRPYRLGDEEDDDDTDYKSPYMSRAYGGSTNGSYGSSKYGASAADTSSYSSSKSSSRFSRLARSNTVNTTDTNFDRPSFDRPPYGGGRFSGRASAAPVDTSSSSRFLQKVRDRKAAGEDVKRDKPFKSRFLGKSFDSDYSSASRSTRASSYSASLSTTPSDTHSTASPSPDSKAEGQ